MKNILICIAVTVLLFGCTSDESSNETERQVLKVGTDATYPPFETVDTETGEPTGFDIDLIKAICKENNWNVEFIVTPFCYDHHTGTCSSS